jgi:BMFP domain-containing protein YqiC
LFGKERFAAGRRRAQASCANRDAGTNAVRAREVNQIPRSRIEMNENLLTELAARLAAIASANPARDLEKNFRGMLSSAFARMDLVTREEYDVQVQVLARAREKLAQLEARLAELEARGR